MSFHHRHLAMMLLEFTMLDGAAPVVVSSQLIEPPGRRGRIPRAKRRRSERVVTRARHAGSSTVCCCHGCSAATRIQRRVARCLLGYQCREQRDDARVRLSAPAADVVLAHDRDHDRGRPRQDRLHGRRRAGRDGAHRQTRGVPLVDRRACRGARRPLPPHAGAGEGGGTRADRRPAAGLARRVLVQQRRRGTWRRSPPNRRCAGTCSSWLRPRHVPRSRASPPKAVTGGGYDGHYFWDTEVYVIPFLAYTSPDIARKLLRFRWRMLPAARRRATELSQRGALYPWRTINGDEASAYYAAGTAQYHINAAVAYALERYLDATGDVEFFVDEGAEMMVETARLWEDLGFYATDGDDSFHIHSVTGPDEYTTVVNDNTYTNMMARFNLWFAAKSVEFLAEWDATSYERLQRRTSLEPARDRGVAPRRRRDVHPLRRGARHPSPGHQLPRARAVGLREHAARPLSLVAPLPPARDLPVPGPQAGRRGAGDVHANGALHPRGEAPRLRLLRPDHDRRLVAVGVRAGDRRRRGRVTTRWRFDYFRHALFLDLWNLHGNTPDGVHIASCGGVWAGLVHGFAGMVDNGEWLRFEPRLPAGWDGMTFRLLRHGARLVVDVDQDGCTVRVETAPGAPIQTAEGVVRFDAGEQVRIPARPGPIGRMSIADRDVDVAAYQASARSWIAEHRRHAPADYGAICPPDLVDHAVDWQRRIHDAGYAGIHWPEQHGGRGLTIEHTAAWQFECASAGVPSAFNMVGHVLAGGAILLLRHARAADGASASDARRRASVVPAVPRARRRQRPRLAHRRAPSSTATTTSSTARRCGAPAAATATGASSWPGPRIRHRSRRGQARRHQLLPVPDGSARASRSARCAR